MVYFHEGYCTKISVFPPKLLFCSRGLTSCLFENCSTWALKVSHVKVSDANAQIKNVYVSGTISMDISAAAVFSHLKSHEGIQDYQGEALMENKEIFHLSVNTATYGVTQAHEQCGVGTVAQFQSGTVAKIQVGSLPGVREGPTHIYRVQSSPP